jgi:tripartite-type tricarboxylate transporter receptor subunit TctC
VPAIIDLIGARVQMMIGSSAGVLHHVKTGKLRALAVTSIEPSALYPGLPAVAASGLPGYESVQRSGMFAPAKTPRTIIDRLNHEIVRFLGSPEVRDKFMNSGVEAVGSSPEQFAAAIKSDMTIIGRLIHDAGIKAA